MKKVLLISHRAERSGAPVLLRNLLQLLCETAHFRFHVLVKEDGPLTKDFNALAPTTVLATRRQPFFRKLRLYITKPWLRLRVRRYDAVLSNTITNGNVHRLIGRHPRVLTYVHELPYVIEKATGKKEVARVLKHTRLFLSPAQSITRHLQTAYGIAPQQIKSLPYYVPDELFRKRPLREPFLKAHGFDAGTFVVGGMGTVGFRKGTDLFLETARCVSAADASVRFVWCGASEPDERAAFASAAAQRGLRETVLRLAETPDPTAVMAGFDLFFLSSREDPYPLVMVEAAMMQIPVVYFGGAGGADEFVGQEAGLAATAFSTADACEQILRLRNNGALREQLAAKGRENYLRKHTKEPVLNAFRNAMEQVFNHR